MAGHAVVHHSGRRLLPAAASLLGLFLLTCLFAQARAAVYTANPANYLQYVGQLRPGDVLRLAPGRYADGLPLRELNGTATQRITITGPETGSPAILMARAGRNTVSIGNASYITLRHLVLDGTGVEADGVKAEWQAQWAHHITLENLRIEGFGPDQQLVGISTKCPAWGWVIRRNVIIGAGTGMYLGDSDGSAPFIGGLIEHNLVMDTRGYNLQIKHQKNRPHLAGIDAASDMTIIRHNVFSKSSGASSGHSARPNVLVGHWPEQGAGVEDRYLIYGNVFYANPHEVLFQGEGNIALYNNLFYNPMGSAIAIQKHNGAPRRVDIFHNTIVARDKGLALSGLEGALRVRVWANAIFAGVPVTGLPPRDNFLRSYGSAGHFLNDPSSTAHAFDFFPKPNRLPRMASEPIPPFVDSERDFNGNIRRLPLPGAYGDEGRNPGWSPALALKPEVPGRGRTVDAGTAR